MRRSLFGVSTIAALVWLARIGLHAEDPVVPVYHEPHHRQVFQYGPTRILDLQIPPGTTTWFHTHEAPVLYVNLATSRSRTQNLGQDWGTGGPPRPAAANLGEAAPAAPRPVPSPPVAGPRVFSTTSYATQPVTHRLQNVGETLSRAIVVINETGGDETTTEQAAGFDGKPELVNRWYRAYRQVLIPGEATRPHRHAEPAVIVQSSDGRGRADGPMKFELNEPGQWAFFDAGVVHEIRNTGETNLQFIEVELRRPAQ
jgi:hypothetical protein